MFLKMSLILALSFPLYVQSKSQIATITNYKGEVLKLLPRKKKADQVKKGDKLYEDTSIYTGPKSFARIRFADKSYINLGPNGKIVINTMKKKEPSMMTLLTGQLRAKVFKNKRNKNKKVKMIIKTRTAAMGVRGTEFHVIFNPKNEVTSLIAFKGSVTMAKMKDRSLELAEKANKQNKQNKKTDIDTEQIKSDVSNVAKDKIFMKPPTTKEIIENVLEKETAVDVHQGRYSGATPAHKETTLPVKISPAQLHVLEKDSEFKNQIKGNKEKNIIKEKDLIKLTEKAVVNDKIKDPPPEGYTNTNTGAFAPRSGGFIDLKSGLYVPPQKDSVLNVKSQVYMPSKGFGAIDSKTGSYVPPKGIELNAVKGFIVAKNITNEKDASKLTDVNQSLLKTKTKKMNTVIKEEVAAIQNEIKAKKKAQVIAAKRNEDFIEESLDMPKGIAPWKIRKHRLIGLGIKIYHDSNIGTTYQGEKVSSQGRDSAIANTKLSLAKYLYPKKRIVINPSLTLENLTYLNDDKGSGAEKLNGYRVEAGIKNHFYHTINSKYADAILDFSAGSTFTNFRDKDSHARYLSFKKFAIAERMYFKSAGFITYKYQHLAFDSTQKNTSNKDLLEYSINTYNIQFASDPKSPSQFIFDIGLDIRNKGEFISKKQSFRVKTQLNFLRIANKYNFKNSINYRVVNVKNSRIHRTEFSPRFSIERIINEKCFLELFYSLKKEYAFNATVSDYQHLSGLHFNYKF